jgi:hypothetical protein
MKGKGCAYLKFSNIVYLLITKALPAIRMAIRRTPDWYAFVLIA